MTSFVRELEAFLKKSLRSNAQVRLCKNCTSDGCLVNDRNQHDSNLETLTHTHLIIPLLLSLRTNQALDSFITLLDKTQA